VAVGLKPGASGVVIPAGAKSTRQQPPKSSPTARATAARCKSAPVLCSAAFVACRAPDADVPANGRSNGTSTQYPVHLLLRPVGWPYRHQPVGRCVPALATTGKSMGIAFSLRPSAGEARKRYAMSAPQALATVAIIWRGSREKWSVGGTRPAQRVRFF
jgi:hypothetical protein